MKGYRHVGYISDVYDLFGVQHLAHVRAARAQCDFLIVGVLADDVATRTTGKAPVIPFAERLAIARSIRVVDAAVGQMSEDLLAAWQQLQFDRLFVAAVFPTHGELQAVGVDIIHLSPMQTSADGPSIRMRDSRPATSTQSG